MEYNEFLTRVIDKGIASAKRDYSNPKNPNHLKMQAGAIAGFEACRHKTPGELGELLENSGRDTKLRMVRNDSDYWWFRCFESEVQWVCNCMSAKLMIEDRPIICTPTAMGVLCANAILEQYENNPDND